MTSANRILLNAGATYAQSLLRMAIGLFSMRWVLQSLGHADFGLYCVVGSLITFIVFINEILGGSNARYYAYAIGEGQKTTPENACDNLKRWFNTALSIHVIVPAMLVVIGYPIGEYAIRHWLNIPIDRLEACVWVFRISCLTAFVSMSTVPYLSMYTAKQLITIRAGFGVAGSVLTFLGAVFLLYAPTDKLLTYATYMMLINAGLPVLQSLLAVRLFPECRVKFSYWWDFSRMRKLLSYAGWTAWGGGGGYLIGSQGCVFVTNRYFGTVINASYGIAGQLSAQTQSLASALLGALSPAVTTKEGSGDRAGTIRLAYRTGKLGVLLILVFAIPMSLEMETLLQLWLGRIPESVVPICIFLLSGAVIERLTAGHQMAIAAAGKVAAWQFAGGVLNVLVFPLAWILAASGFGVKAAACAAFACPCCTFVTNLLFAKKLVNMSIIPWARQVLLPLLSLMAIVTFSGWIVTKLAEPCFARLVVTTGVCLLMTFMVGWFSVIDGVEKASIMHLFGRTLEMVWRKGVD